MPNSTNNLNRLIECLVLVVVMLAGAMAMSPSVADPDLWGHVQFGRDVIADGWFPNTNPYSYNAEGHRWINHENLSELTMAWTVDHIGPLGLVFGKFLLSLAVLGSLLWFNARRGVELIPNCIIVLLVAWNLGYHWSFRPQISSFVCFTGLALLLNWSFFHWRERWHLPVPGAKWFARAGQDPKSDWRAEDLNYSNFHSRFLWLAPVLFFVWANSHGGFVAGLCIFGAYLGCRTLEAFGRRGKLGWGLARRMALMFTVAGLATLLNPYSYRLLGWLLESLGQPRPEISDWSQDMLFSMIGIKFWALLAVAGFAIAFTRRSWDFTETVILGLTLWQAISHFRHVPFFAILVGFWLAPHLQSALKRFAKPSTNQESLTDTRLGRYATVAGCLIVSTIIGLQLHGRLNQLKVDRSVFPVDAFQYVHDQDMSGKIVITYDWAQYAIAAFCTEQSASGTESKVAFDGRFRTCYPQILVDLHFDWLFGNGPDVARSRSPKSPPCDPLAILNLNSPNIVINRKHGEKTDYHMQLADSEWVLLYEDTIAQVWGRRSVYDQPELPTYIPAEDRELGNKPVNGYVNWPALPRHREIQTTKKTHAKHNITISQSASR